MENLERILADHPFFEGFSHPHLELFTGCASNVRFAKDEPIFHEGGEANHFYLVREGKVRLETTAGHYDPIVIDKVREGDVLGWSWLIPPHRWRFGAIAAEPVRAIALDGKCLRKKCEEDHDLGYELLMRFSHIMAKRLQATRMQLLDVYQAWSEITEGR